MVTITIKKVWQVFTPAVPRQLRPKPCFSKRQTDSACWNKLHTCKFHSTQIPSHSPKYHLWPCLTINIWIDNQSNDQTGKIGVTVNEIGSDLRCEYLDVQLCWKQFTKLFTIVNHPEAFLAVSRVLVYFISDNVSHCFWTNTHQIQRWQQRQWEYGHY